MERPPLESFFKSPIQKEDLEVSDDVVIKKLKGAKGEKGDKGDKGDRGDDGITPTEELLEALILPLIPDPIPGEKGKDGERGPRGFVGEEGKPGKDGRDGIDGKDGSLTEISSKDVIDKINKSRGEKIKKSKVEGFDEIEGIARTAQNQVQNFISLGGNRQTKVKVGSVIYTGVDTLSFTSGVTATPVGDGTTLNLAIAGGGGGSLVGSQEKSTTTPDGVTQTFAFANTPTLIFWNGSFQTLTDDYTVSGNNITFTSSAGTPQVNDKIVNVYA